MGMRSVDQSNDSPAIQRVVTNTERVAAGGPVTVGPGSTSYDLVAAEASSAIHLHDLLIEADEDCTWTLWSGNVAAIMGPHTLKAGQPPTTWSCPLPGGVRIDLETPLQLVTDSATATFKITRHYTFRA